MYLIYIMEQLLSMFSIVYFILDMYVSMMYILSMKLRIELVPRTSWYNNLRKKIDPTDWKLISGYVRDMNDRTCEICGWKEADHPGEYTHCHEVWRYEGDGEHQLLLDGCEHVQVLDRFECVCPTCHSVHHIGHSQIIGKDIGKLRKHAMKVNNCSGDEWLVYEAACWATWYLRSKVQWEVDIVGII